MSLDSTSNSLAFRTETRADVLFFQFRIHILIALYRETRRKFWEQQTRATCAERRGSRKKILNFRSKGNYARVKSPFMSLPSTGLFCLKRGKRDEYRSCEKGIETSRNVAWCRNDRITWLMFSLIYFIVKGNLIDRVHLDRSLTAEDRKLMYRKFLQKLIESETRLLPTTTINLFLTL